MTWEIPVDAWPFMQSLIWLNRFFWDCLFCTSRSALSLLDSGKFLIMLSFHSRSRKVMASFLSSLLVLFAFLKFFATVLGCVHSSWSLAIFSLVAIWFRTSFKHLLFLIPLYAILQSWWLSMASRRVLDLGGLRFPLAFFLRKSSLRWLLCLKR